MTCTVWTIQTLNLYMVLQTQRPWKPSQAGYEVQDPHVVDDLNP